MLMPFALYTLFKLNRQQAAKLDTIMNEIDLKDISILSRKFLHTNIDNMIDKMTEDNKKIKESFYKVMEVHLKKFGHFDISQI